MCVCAASITLLCVWCVVLAAWVAVGVSEEMCDCVYICLFLCKCGFTCGFVMCVYMHMCIQPCVGCARARVLLCGCAYECVFVFVCE